MSNIPVLQARIRGVQGAPGRSNILSIEEFSQTSIDGQTTIQFPEGKEYILGNNSLFIYVNGVILPKSAYIEATPTLVRFVTPQPADVEILVKYINYEETDTVKEVVVLEREPTHLNSNLRDGLIWFNPLTKSFAVYSVDDEFFIEIAYRRDFDSPNIIIPMDGGTF